MTIYDYIVIGGGISGLNIAYKLSDNKNSILLVEKNHRLGGRIHTYKLEDNKMLYEAGAARFHKGHKNLVNLIKIFDLEKNMVEIPTKRQFYPNRYKYNIPKKYEDFQNIFNEVIQKSKKLLDNELRTHSFIDLVTRFINKEVAKYLENGYGYLSELIHMNGKQSVDSFEHDLNTKFNYYVLKNGLSELIDNMEKFIVENGCKINKSATLNKINLHDGIYELELNKFVSGKFKVDKVKCKKLILALDKHSLLNIDYLKPLKNKLESVNMKCLNRIYAIYPKDKKTNKVWFHDVKLQTTDYDLKFIIPIDYKHGLIMISYCDDKFAEFWENKMVEGEDKLVEEISKQLKLIFPKKNIPKPKYIKSHFWEHGVSYWNLGVHAEKINKEIEKPFSNEDLYICGESYSMRQGWCEGALESSNSIINLLNGIKKNKTPKKSNKIKNTIGKNSKKKSKKKRKKKSSKEEQEGGKSLKSYTLKEIKKHNKKNNLWIIIKDKVVNVTKWQNSHPGGSSILKKYGGKDATEAFVNRGHSDYAYKMMKSFIIGKVKK